MTVTARTCPECKGEGLQAGDGGGMDGGGNYHHPPCTTCDDRGEVVPADFYRGAVEALASLRAAWDAHMKTCPQHANAPTLADIDTWMSAPSNTASGGQ